MITVNECISVMIMLGLKSKKKYIMYRVWCAIQSIANACMRVVLLTSKDDAVRSQTEILIDCICVGGRGKNLGNT